MFKCLVDLTGRSRDRYWFVSPQENADTPKVKAFRKWVKEELRR